MKYVSSMLLALAVIVCFCAQVCADDGQGARPVRLEASTSRLSLGRSMGVFEDAGQGVTIDDIVNDGNAYRFVPSDRDIPGFGFSSAAYWMKIPLHHDLPHDAEWLLEFAYAPMQFLDVYLVRNGHVITHLKGGSSLKPHERPFEYRTHIFPLTLAPQADYTLLVRAAGETSKSLPLLIWSPKAFARMAADEFCFYGLYLGTIIALVAYNLFIFFSLREWVYAVYSGFLLSIITFFLSFSGLGSLYVWTGLGASGVRLITLSIAMALAFACIFSVIFLQLDLRRSALARVLFAISFLCFALGLSSLLVSYHLAIVAVVIFGFLAVCTVFYTGINAFLSGSVPARYYMAAWGLLLIGAAIQMLTLGGVLPQSFLGYYGAFIGSSAEAVLLSVALAARMKKMRDEKMEAEHEAVMQKQSALDAMAAFTHRLQMEVEKRTHELQIANEKIVAHEKLSAMTVFSAGMAHEINNPANFVSVGAQNAKAQVDDLQHFIAELIDDDADQQLKQAFGTRFKKINTSLGVVSTGVERIRHVISELRSSQVEGTLAVQSVDIVALADEALAEALKTTTLAVKIRRHVEDGIRFDAMVEDMQKLLQVVASNAVHALEDKFCKSVPGEQPQLTLIVLQNDATVTITLSDNGAGIAGDILDKVFDPFFTTKEVGRGMGIGLATAQNIARKYGGGIEVGSLENFGTSAVITLGAVRGA